jgi:hypothetical protein
MQAQRTTSESTKTSSSDNTAKNMKLGEQQQTKTMRFKQKLQCILACFWNVFP